MLLLSLSVMSSSLQPHGLQNARLPCPCVLEFAQIHVRWLSNAIQPASHPAFSLFQHQGFSNKLAVCIWWPKYWSFSFNINPYNEHSGLIFFRVDWLNLLAVQGTLKSLLQYHRSKTSIFQHSTLFIVQLTLSYMTTGNTITLTKWTFVGEKRLCFLICCLGWP